MNTVTNGCGCGKPRTQTTTRPITTKPTTPPTKPTSK